MRKNSTLFSTEPLISHDENEVKPAANAEPVPSEAVIQNIINYSKALQINKSEEVGVVEVVLN